MKKEPKKECIITKIMQMDAKMAYDSLPKQELPIINGSYGCTIETKRQETLKEIAERLYPNREFFLTRFQDIERKAFIKGYKLAQEKSYSEKKVFNICSELSSYFISGDNFDLKEWFDKIKKK